MESKALFWKSSSIHFISIFVKDKHFYTNLEFSAIFWHEEIFPNWFPINILQEDIFANSSKNSQNFANSQKLLPLK